VPDDRGGIELVRKRMADETEVFRSHMNKLKEKADLEARGKKTQ